MSSGADQPYSVQRFRGGFALVWWEQPDDNPETEPKRHRRQLAAQDRASAEAEARTVWEGADDSAWTVGRIMTGYIASIEGKPSHSRTKDAWKAMKPFWENVDPATIDETMCRNYRATRRVGDATARLELMKVSTALNWAMKAPHRYISVRGEVWLPPKPERKTRHLTRPEFDRFLDGMVAPHARLYALIGLFTCARPGAILDLTWDRVDFMRGQIDLNPAGRTQTAKRRPVVPIGDRLMTALQEAYAARTSVYVVERAGKQIGNIKKAFQAASERSGVHATPYTLRHTGAVWAAEAGVPMSELAQMLGHDDDRTTQQHYARYSPGYLKRVADAIEKGRISA